jgi:branched-chain amino acid transport system ATP-binding protein
VAEATPARPVLHARGLTRRFGGLTAVDRVGLDLHAGQVHAVIGTNGAGKSTLINLLSGELAPSAGHVELDGRRIDRWAQPRRARAGVGRSYQRTTLFSGFSVLENARLSAQATLPRPWAFWQGAAHCRHSLEAAQQALAAAGLSAHAHRVAGTLSHGAQRQLEIAMCLATKPRVLLLDEPLAGMGAQESRQMLELLVELKREHAVLLVEHDMDAVFQIADHITVMVDGAVIASGTPEHVRADPAVQRAYLGEPH